MAWKNSMDYKKLYGHVNLKQLWKERRYLCCFEHDVLALWLGNDKYRITIFVRAKLELTEVGPQTAWMWIIIVLIMDERT
jgi:hypothetical protein